MYLWYHPIILGCVWGFARKSSSLLPVETDVCCFGPTERSKCSSLSAAPKTPHICSKYSSKFKYVIKAHIDLQLMCTDLDFFFLPTSIFLRRSSSLVWLACRLCSDRNSFSFCSSISFSSWLFWKRIFETKRKKNNFHFGRRLIKKQSALKVCLLKTYWKVVHLMVSKYLLHVSLQNIVIFFGLLDRLCELGSGLVQLLIQSLMWTLKLSQVLHKSEQSSYIWDISGNFKKLDSEVALSCLTFWLFLSWSLSFCSSVCLQLSALCLWQLSSSLTCFIFCSTAEY